MKIATIKAKLILLLGILVISFGILGYELNEIASNGKIMATRIMMVNEVKEHFFEMRLEQRNYQIYFQEKNLENYKKSLSIGMRLMNRVWLFCKNMVKK